MLTDLIQVIDCLTPEQIIGREFSSPSVRLLVVVMLEALQATHGSAKDLLWELFYVDYDVSPKLQKDIKLEFDINEYTIEVLELPEWYINETSKVSFTDMLDDVGLETGN